MVKCWKKYSVPSPAVHDSIIEKRKGKRVRLDQVRNMKPDGKLESIKYKHVQKRYHSETSIVIYENWKIDQNILIQREILDQNKHIPSHQTFKNYKPDHIHKGKHLTQCLCDNCTKFGFMWEANMKYLVNIDKCKTINCINYNVSMGNRCNCDLCNNCTINYYKNISAYDLFDNICCHSHSMFPFMLCAQGKCGDMYCNVGKFRQLINNCDGCHNLLRIPNKNITYKFIAKDPKSKQVWIAKKTMKYEIFAILFLASLKDYIWHQYVKRKQYYEKRILFTQIRNVYLLRPDWLFVTIDYIGDYFLKTPIMTSGMSTKIGKVQYLVMYQRKIRNNKIIETALNLFGDHEKKGWNTFIPILSWYIGAKKVEFSNEGIPLKLLVLHSDRGPHDFWCQPSHVYMSDIAKQHQIPIKHDTTAAGHSKSYHDQIGGTCKSFLDRSADNGQLQLVHGESVAKQIVRFCRANFSVSHNGKLQREFYHVPESIIYSKGSPFDSPLDIDGYGIKKFHSAFISINGNIKYRMIACNCKMCCNSLFSRCCNQYLFAGKYIKLPSIPVHLPYATMRDNQCDDDNDSNNDHNNT